MNLCEGIRPVLVDVEVVGHAPIQIGILIGMPLVRRSRFRRSPLGGVSLHVCLDAQRTLPAGHQSNMAWNDRSQWITA